VEIDRTAVLVEGSKFSGQVVGKDLTVLGSLEGTVEMKGALRIGPQAHVKATIRAQAVEVNGTFDGEIQATSLAFGENARARGVFRAERLSIREGALVDGAVNLPGSQTAQQAPAPQTTTVPENPTPAPAAAAPASGEDTSGQAVKLLLPPASPLPM
jgi:cytoskeletal protein CcmA (bactofilin family)